MRKTIAMVALLGLVAAPVMADLTLSPSSLAPVGRQLGTNGAHTTGPWVAGAMTNTDVIINATASDTFSVTFAFHWPYTSTAGLYPLQLQSSLVWDSDEIQVLDVTTAPGIFFHADNTNNNINAITFWPTVTNSGTVVVGDVLGTGTPLWQNPNTFQLLTSSSEFPFMKVDFQVINPEDDGLLDLVIGSAALLFGVTTTPGTYWTAGAIGTTAFGYAITPEPASLALLGLGLATTGIGAWRRRSR